jgi:hypothetical protein
MKSYKKKITSRMFLCAVIVIISVALIICQNAGALSFWETIKPNEAVTGFQQGLLTGVCFLALISLFKYSNAVRDEKKLQILHNKEIDERMLLIRQKSGMPMLMITSGIMIFSGIISGYFSETVFFTLIAAAVIQLTIGLGIKIYYLKKV